MSKELSFVLLITVSLVGGCAFNSQTANLAPRTVVASSTEGRNVAVGVRVLDERPSKSLGRRGSGYGPAAEITAAQDLAVIVSDQVKDALRKKGFQPVAYSPSENVGLTVEIRLLEYSTSMGFWTGGVHMRGALKAVAHRGSESYENLYRVEREDRVVVTPTASSNEVMINDALTELLSQLAGDSSLIRFLAASGDAAQDSTPVAGSN